MILVSPPYRTNWGCLLADSGTIRRKLLDQLRDALVCSYYVRCVSTQRFLADVSVNHSRTGAVKLLITRRTSQSSKLLRGTVRRTTACPRRPQLGCDPAPLQKDDSTLRLAYSALELSPWAMPAHAVGNPGRPGRADVARQAFSSIAAMYPVLASATAPAISGALSTRPQRRRRRWPDSRSELLPSRDALRPE